MLVVHPALCDPMDCNPPGSSVHGFLQARILEWVVISFSRKAKVICICISMWIIVLFTTANIWKDLIWFKSCSVRLSRSVTLCDPMDWMVRGIRQARILECVAFPFYEGPSQPRDRTQFSGIAGGFFTNWAMRENPKSQLNNCGNLLSQETETLKCSSGQVPFLWHFLLHCCLHPWSLTPSLPGAKRNVGAPYGSPLRGDRNILPPDPPPQLLGKHCTSHWRALGLVTRPEPITYWQAGGLVA